MSNEEKEVEIDFEEDEDTVSIGFTQQFDSQEWEVDKDGARRVDKDDYLDVFSFL